MAEVILKNKIKLAGLKGVRVSSAGLWANEGDKMSKNSQQALKQLGYKPYGFKAKKASPDVLLKYDYILCVTNGHKAQIRHFPGVYTIDEITGIGDVPDPYGGGLLDYIKASHKLEDACNIIIEKLIENEGELV